MTGVPSIERHSLTGVVGIESPSGVPPEGYTPRGVTPKRGTPKRGPLKGGWGQGGRPQRGVASRGAGQGAVGKPIRGGLPSPRCRVGGWGVRACGSGLPRPLGGLSGEATHERDARSSSRDSTSRAGRLGFRIRGASPGGDRCGVGWDRSSSTRDGGKRSRLELGSAPARLGRREQLEVRPRPASDRARYKCRVPIPRCTAHCRARTGFGFQNGRGVSRVPRGPAAASSWSILSNFFQKLSEHRGGFKPRRCATSALDAARKPTDKTGGGAVLASFPRFFFVLQRFGPGSSGRFQAETLERRREGAA
jgi:hypothetical protein